MNIQSIIAAIHNFRAIRILKKEWLADFITEKNNTLSDTDLQRLAEDLFGLKSFFDRSLENYEIENVPFWEFSNCLYWLNKHYYFSGYELFYPNSSRILANFREFYLFLKRNGIVSSTGEIDKAIEVILRNGLVTLILDIPYTGKETYRTVVKKGHKVCFFVYDKWLLILLEDIEWNWSRFYDKANSVSAEKYWLCAILKTKLDFMGHTSIWDVVKEDIYPADVQRAVRWFYEISPP